MGAVLELVNLSVRLLRIYGQVVYFARDLFVCITNQNVTIHAY